MRLLLVEDDTQLAQGVAAALRQSGYAVDWMISGNAANTALQTQDYDAVVLDLNLPGLDGFEVLRQLRRRGRDIPVLILSAREGATARVTGLDLGADDYLTKPFDLPELEARLRALIRRSQGRSGSKLQVGLVTLDTVNRQVESNGSIVDLTPREFGILEILMSRSGHVVSKQHLAERLCEWGEEMSNTAVEIQVHRLRKKLEDSGIALRTVRGFGYLLEAGNDPQPA
ncbi:MAG: response regulator [Thiobacillaceae bacterium]|jgi:two-component system OmpR family response regulator